VIKVNLEESGSLDNLYDTTKPKFEIAGTTASAWNGYKNDFLKQSKILIRGSVNTNEPSKNKASNTLNEKEMEIIKTIYSSSGHSISPGSISIITKFSRPVTDILIKGLIQKKHLKNVGSDYQLTEKAVKLLEGIE
ncbi:MAG: hypothetical protein IPL55_00380, partial [Saprospiraceae bacterium]|nr:hypothetical protein [Saprospiraceae bacterium]